MPCRTYSFGTGHQKSAENKGARRGIKEDFCIVKQNELIRAFGQNVCKKARHLQRPLAFVMVEHPAREFQVHVEEGRSNSLIKFVKHTGLPAARRGHDQNETVVLPNRFCDFANRSV